LGEKRIFKGLIEMMNIEGGAAGMFSQPDDMGALTYQHFDSAGNLKPYFLADKKLGGQIRGYSMIKQDLENTEGMLTKSLKEEFKDFAEVLWHTSVVSYGRCFVQAKGRGTCLEVAQVRMAGAEHEETHRQVMEWRHEYVAHSGDNDEQLAVVIVPLEGEIEKAEIGLPYPFLMRKLSPSKEDLERFIKMVKDLQQVVNTLARKAKEQLFEFYSSQSLEERQRLFGLRR
jgi:hypothetical protein